MPGGLNLAQLLPARYVINHHVPSPLTCRHKHRCGCHPAPPERPAKPLSEKIQEKVNQEVDRQMMEDVRQAVQNVADEQGKAMALFVTDGL